MAFDASLAERVRKSLSKHDNLSERRQFGGVAFLIDGNVACGIIGNDMLVRVGPALHDKVMLEKNVKEFSLTGRPSKGWVIVGSGALKTASQLGRWLKLGVDFASTLPPK